LNARADNPAPVLNEGTSLAYERTYLAHERTQMAWIRTALSLISFGFTIAKFFEYLDQKHTGPAPAMGPREVGILMISLGLVALALATLQHWHALRRLHARCPDLPRSLSWVIAALLAVLGLFALGGAIVRG
jgi:putative membrane protein